MGSKAEYEARKAAKRAQRGAEAATQQPAASEAHVVQAAEAAPDADQELRYRNTFTAGQEAYQAAALARLTPFIMVGADDIGRLLVGRVVMREEAASLPWFKPAGSELVRDRAG
jgi:hypothetical protein